MARNAVGFRRAGLLLTLVSLSIAVFWFFTPDNSRLEPALVLASLFSTIVNLAAAWASPPLTGLSRNAVFTRVAESNPTQDWEEGARQGGELYYYVWDSNLCIEHDRIKSARQAFREPWVLKFPDKENVWSEEYVVRLGTTSIASFRMVVVDGGRAIMPLPKGPQDLKITRLQYVLAKVFDRLDTLDDYMRQAGFETVEEATLSPTS